MTHTTKENRDVYYRKAKEEGYRARSAYKLQQIFESYHILYPILDEESALSILKNSSCVDCQDKLYANHEPNSNTHLNSKLDLGLDLNTHSNSKSNSNNNLDRNPDSDSDSDLTDYINIKRNCLSLGRIKNVVDLCSAPGSWSQLLRNLVYHDYITLKNACNKLNETSSVCNNLVEYLNIKPSIVAIDLQQMAPVDGVHFLKGDITDPKVLDKVSNLFLENVSKNLNQVFNGSISDQLRGNAQLITCDGAPDVSGLHETDSFLQSSLIKSALSVCLSLLDPDGYFICKTFFGSEDTPVFSEVCAFFDYCTIFKPPASRVSSFEHFIVAIGFRPLGQFLINPSSSTSGSNELVKSINSHNTHNLINDNHVESNPTITITSTNDKSKYEHDLDSQLKELIKHIPQILAGDLSPYDRLPLRKPNQRTV